VQQLVDEAHARFRDIDEGEVSQVYPALARVAPGQLGICVVGADGSMACAGDHGTGFAIMSVSKPFLFALVCDWIGAATVHDLVGVNATGLPFNSLAGIEFGQDGKTNPMVNAGAIAVTSLVAGASSEAKWQAIREGLSRFAGRELQLDQEVYDSASQTNFRNRGIAYMLRSLDRIQGDPDVVTDLYTRQCSLAVTAKDLAVMGATLAHGGVNPLTGERVVDPMTCHYTLAVMITAGMYETSGDWLYEIGLPGKSGIGGGIVTVSPGKGALATFAPRLDAAGNSVQGREVAKFLSHGLGLDMLVSGAA
jgi:glutaminase